jgi:ergothioneine biosynthesis protein EgtB
MNPASILAKYSKVRNATQAFIAPLSSEDMALQSMPDVSPTKWHLAHTSWFWETFLLQASSPGYIVFDPHYNHLFNSYYERIGERHDRAERGLLSRPPLEDVLRYRTYVDESVARFLSSAAATQIGEVEAVILLGLAHEQQHQELLLMDIKHVLSRHPFAPAAYAPPEDCKEISLPSRWVSFEGGTYRFGHSENSFCFDNEGPAHQAVLTDFQLAEQPVNNREYLQFVEDGGYSNALLWLSDGWAWRCCNDIEAPLYWRKLEGQWHEFTLHGQHLLDLAAPVTHLSFYEACAYAEWADARLPEEREWEFAARTTDGVPGRFAEAGVSAHPAACVEGEAGNLQQMLGGVWEWTRSAYSPYPRYKAARDAVGEYNGKFMCGQFVMRGGSCATPPDHVRDTYRNFFPPQARWQFSGLRLARDI